MLQDVVVCLGLWIDGRPVTGPQTPDSLAIYKELLAVVPDALPLDGRRLRLSWLQDNFIEPQMPQTRSFVKMSRPTFYHWLGLSYFGPDVQLSVLSLL